MTFLILSTCGRKRYKNNMLACLSSPRGKQLQYRYDRKLFTKEALDGLYSGEKKLALVCYIDNTKFDYSPIISVREAEIKSVSEFGSSIALTIEIMDFAFSSDADILSKEVQQLGCGTLPVLNKEGFLVHKIQRYPPCLKIGNSIDLWEKVVGSLHDREKFKDEEFFFGLPTLYDGSYGQKVQLEGIKEKYLIVKWWFRAIKYFRWNQLGSIRIKAFEPWPSKLKLNKSYMLVIIIYHPNKDHGDIRGCTIKLESNLKLFSENPDDFEIDSLYDIRFYKFKILQESMTPEKSGWITLESLKDKISVWKLPLPFSLERPWIKTATTIAILGILISAPSVLAFWRDSEGLDKVTATILAVIFGCAASTIAVLSIKRVV